MKHITVVAIISTFILGCNLPRNLTVISYNLLNEDCINENRLALIDGIILYYPVNVQYQEKIYPMLLSNQDVLHLNNIDFYSTEQVEAYSDSFSKILSSSQRIFTVEKIDSFYFTQHLIEIKLFREYQKTNHELPSIEKKYINSNGLIKDAFYPLNHATNTSLAYLVDNGYYIIGGGISGKLSVHRDAMDCIGRAEK